MSLHRERAKQISDQLSMLSVMLKTRSRAGLTDGNRLLETIVARLFNAIFGWNLVNLKTNYPAADLGDRQLGIAIQVTNEDSSDKIKDTAAKASQHRLGAEFGQLIVFFLLDEKPALPKKFTQPPGGPVIETWDNADLLKRLLDLKDLEAISRAAKVLDEEMGKIPAPGTGPIFDISRILEYAPERLLGRKAETKFLNAAWTKVRKRIKKRPHVLTFVALGGEGKTSLVAKWAAGLAHQDWPGCDAALAWSFYRHGSDEKTSVPSDLFLKEALTLFGGDEDKAFASSNAGAFEKGQRLARLVGQRRSLLILDGLEPLQYAPSAPTPGGLKDQGIAALLKGLAATSHGLCVVTTRYPIHELRGQTTAPEVKLLRLSRDEGVHLLKTLGVKGSELRNIPFNDGKEKLNEFEKLVEDVKGHALTLTLFGGFLKRAFHGDIRQRDRVKFEKADEKMDGGHAFRTMAAYEKWLLRDGGDEGRREVAVLRLMGLFDRPADAGCLTALRSETIRGLTEPLAALPDDDWEFCLSGLEAAKLLTLSRDASGALRSLDAHPLLREYFARQLRTQRPEAWRAAHRRLYEHLCEATSDNKPNPTLEELQPLYQAVAHGGAAGLQRKAFLDVFKRRILRESHFYSVNNLGAIESDINCITWFFRKRWQEACPEIPKSGGAFLSRHAGYCLRASCRLNEALSALASASEAYEDLKMFDDAVDAQGLHCHVNVLLGNLAGARRSAEQCVRLSEKSKLDFWRMVAFSRVAEVYSEQGEFKAAESAFYRGLRSDEERSQEPLSFKLIGMLKDYRDERRFHGVFERYCQFELARNNWDIAQDVCKHALDVLSRTPFGMHDKLHLGIARVFLGQAMLGIALRSRSLLAFEDCDPSLPLFANAGQLLRLSLEDFRGGGRQHEFPRSLLSLAVYHRSLAWRAVGFDTARNLHAARAVLEEASEIAERGPMKLHMADIYLHRARLFFREKPYPWKSPQDDLTAAEKLINDCGYHRRDEELADAKRVILGT